MSATPRLGLPFLSPGQAQKEFFHNEALQTLDMIVAGTVEEPPRAAPPGSPALGSAYIVDLSPTGAWAGRPQNLAAWTSGGWRFIAPLEGMSVHIRTTGTRAIYRSGAWETGAIRGDAVIIGGQPVVGSRAAAIASAAGGTVVDAEARAAIGQILGALRSHGLIAT